MAKYPKAIEELIPPGSNDPAIKAVGVVYHVAVSTSPDIRPIFTNGSGIESHFYVRFDGTVLQYRDTAFEADAQFAGNSWGSPREGMISIETEGMGDGTWTPEQIQALKDLTVWAAKTHGFKVRKATAWNSGGVGYHSQFKEWNTDLHSCPGPNRIKQFESIFVPWFPHALDPPPPPPTPQPPKTETTTAVVVQSGHNLATSSQLTAALDAHRKTLDATVHADDCKLILLTEQAAAKFADPLQAWADATGYHLFHPTTPGPSECAILSSRPLKTQTYFLLTKLRLDPKVTGRKAPIYVVAARPEGDEWFGVWHSPAHSQGLKKGNIATRVYLSCVSGLRKWRMTVNGQPTIGGDFNASPKKVTDTFAAKFPTFAWAGTKGQAPTEGGRVIDGLLTRRRVVKHAKTLPKRPGFDHSPVLIVLG